MNFFDDFSEEPDDSSRAPSWISTDDEEEDVVFHHDNATGSPTTTGNVAPSQSASGEQQLHSPDSSGRLENDITGPQLLQNPNNGVPEPTAAAGQPQQQHHTSTHHSAASDSNNINDVPRQQSTFIENGSIGEHPEPEHHQQTQDSFTSTLAAESTPLLPSTAAVERKQQMVPPPPPPPPPPAPKILPKKKNDTTSSATSASTAPGGRDALLSSIRNGGFKLRKVPKGEIKRPKSPKTLQREKLSGGAGNSANGNSPNVTSTGNPLMDQLRRAMMKSRSVSSLQSGTSAGTEKYPSQVRDEIVKITKDEEEEDEDLLVSPSSVPMSPPGTSTNQTATKAAPPPPPPPPAAVSSSRSAPPPPPPPPSAPVPAPINVDSSNQQNRRNDNYTTQSAFSAHSDSFDDSDDSDDGLRSPQSALRASLTSRLLSRHSTGTLDTPMTPVSQQGRQEFTENPQASAEQAAPTSSSSPPPAPAMTSSTLAANQPTRNDYPSQQQQTTTSQQISSNHEGMDYHQLMEKTDRILALLANHGISEGAQSKEREHPSETNQQPKHDDDDEYNYVHEDSTGTYSKTLDEHTNPYGYVHSPASDHKQRDDSQTQEKEQSASVEDDTSVAEDAPQIAQDRESEPQKTKKHASRSTHKHRSSRHRHHHRSSSRRKKRRSRENEVRRASHKQRHAPRDDASSHYSHHQHHDEEVPSILSGEDDSLHEDSPQSQYTFSVDSESVTTYQESHPDDVSSVWTYEDDASTVISEATSVNSPQRRKKPTPKRPPPPTSRAKHRSSRRRTAPAGRRKRKHTSPPNQESSTPHESQPNQPTIDEEELWRRMEQRMEEKMQAVVEQRVNDLLEKKLSSRLTSIRDQMSSELKRLENAMSSVEEGTTRHLNQVEHRLSVSEEMIQQPLNMMEAMYGFYEHVFNGESSRQLMQAQQHARRLRHKRDEERNLHQSYAEASNRKLQDFTGGVSKGASLESVSNGVSGINGRQQSRNNGNAPSNDENVLHEYAYVHHSGGVEKDTGGIPSNVVDEGNDDGANDSFSYVHSNQMDEGKSMTSHHKSGLSRLEIPKRDSFGSQPRTHALRNDVSHEVPTPDMTGILRFQKGANREMFAPYSPNTPTLHGVSRPPPIVTNAIGDSYYSPGGGLTPSPTTYFQYSPEIQHLETTLRSFVRPDKR